VGFLLTHSMWLDAIICSGVIASFFGDMVTLSITVVYFWNGNAWEDGGEMNGSVDLFYKARRFLIARSEIDNFDLVEVNWGIAVR
jgi:hypothetical protein